jgi:chemotaxis protein CheD
LERDVPDFAHNSFEHVKIMYESRFDRQMAMILPGEYYVSGHPMIIYTVLGSCVSACIRDPYIRISGMNHFMLPETCGAIDNPLSQSARYGTFAMEVLINEILGRGGRRERLEVKLFGGGNMFGHTMADIGRNNVEFAKNYILREGLQIVSQDIGEAYPRKIFYFTDTGRVLLKKIARLKNDTIVVRERAYKQSLLHEPAGQDVTLF